MDISKVHALLDLDWPAAVHGMDDAAVQSLLRAYNLDWLLNPLVPESLPPELDDLFETAMLAGQLTDSEQQAVENWLSANADSSASGSPASPNPESSSDATLSFEEASSLLDSLLSPEESSDTEMQPETQLNENADSSASGSPALADLNAASASAPASAVRQPWLKRISVIGGLVAALVLIDAVVLVQMSHSVQTKKTVFELKEQVQKLKQDVAQAQDNAQQAQAAAAKAQKAQAEAEARVAAGFSWQATTDGALEEAKTVVGGYTVSK